MHSTAEDHPKEEVLDWWQVDQPRYEVTDAIKKAVAASRAADGALVGPFELQLAVVLDRYAHRRTVVANMVRDVAELAVGRVAEVEVLHEKYVAGLVDSHERLVDEVRRQLALVTEQRDAAERQLREARSIYESRFAFDNKVACTFRNGSSFRIWSPALLEEVAYRVRAGGGDDDHAIHVKVPKDEKDGVVEFVAHLPNPDMVSFDLATPQRPPKSGSRTPAPAAAGATSTWAQWWPSRRLSPVAAVTFLGLFVLACVGGITAGLEAVLR